MRATTLSLPMVGMIFGLAIPANASVPSEAKLENVLMIVNQQNTCKEGEVWDENQKKCVRKQG